MFVPPPSSDGSVHNSDRTTNTYSTNGNDQTIPTRLTDHDQYSTHDNNQKHDSDKYDITTPEYPHPTPGNLDQLKDSLSTAGIIADKELLLRKKQKEKKDDTI